MLNVRWYLSYKLSYRDLEEMAAERGLEVGHTTIYRWVIKFTPELEKAARLPIKQAVFLLRIYKRNKALECPA